MNFSVEFITIGKLKSNSPFFALFDEYKKRLKGKFNLIQMDAQNTPAEHQKILDKIHRNAKLIVLDETGKTLPSIEFAKTLEKYQIDSPSTPIQFVIGGADGLSKEILQRANLIISFGKQTWPHMMVRVMLIEQVYRAQQILANHPYHRQ